MKFISSGHFVNLCGCLIVINALIFQPTIIFVCVWKSAEADYEQVPVEAYGYAMIRGMGWKKSEGIGRTFKQ